MSNHSLDHLIALSSSLNNIRDIETRGCEDHRLAAVLILAMPGENGAELLLTKRSDALPNHAGQISFPGGACESQDDSLIDTALREAREEVGIQTGNIDILGTLDMTLLPSGFAVLPVVAVVGETPVLKPDPAEVAEIFTLPLEKVSHPDSFKQDSYDRNGFKREFYYIEYKEYYIWGATAGMLHKLASLWQEVHH